MQEARKEINLSSIKGLFAGSGGKGLNEVEVRDSIIKLTKK
jgi:hypothetical protein